MPMQAPPAHKNPPIYESDAIALVACIDNMIERLHADRRRITASYMPTPLNLYAQGRPGPMRIADVLMILRNSTDSRLRLTELVKNIVDAAVRGSSATRHPLDTGDTP